MSDQTDGKPGATGRVTLHDDPHRYRIGPIGSGPVAWAIERFEGRWTADLLSSCRAFGAIVG